MNLPTRLRFREIEPGDSITGFSLGDSEDLPLKIFLQKCARSFHKGNIARTYVLAEHRKELAPRIWAYITLVCAEVTLTKEYRPDDCDEASQYKTFPAAKIARLAVDRRIQGQGYGEILVSWAIGMLRQNIMPAIGCRFFIVDSKRKVVSYYERVGFTFLNTEKNRKAKQPRL